MIIYLFYKSSRKLFSFIFSFFNKYKSRYILLGNNVRFKNFRTNGIPYIMVARGGRFTIGENFAMNNGIEGNPIGCYDKCTFFVNSGAILTIGDNVGLSQTGVICHQSITIGNNVKIGGGVKIYDTDFHSLDSKIRATKDDLRYKINKPVIIQDNVFIGAYSIVLKGVTIGENSIIGAGSIVTKSIPSNQIWAGNPAKFIRNL